MTSLLTSPTELITSQTEKRVVLTSPDHAHGAEVAEMRYITTVAAK
jgi:hypothetical protein